MADQTLSDEQLIAVAKSGDSSLLRALNSQERQRLIALSQQPDGPRLSAATPGTAIPPGQRARTWTDTAVDALPMIGGAVGGTVGSIGGTVGGFGVGGVPGAIGGATLGGGAGEAARQLVNRARGVAAPSTMTGAAKGIGTQAAIQGAMEGAGQAIMPVVGKVAQSVYRGYLKPSLARVNLPKATQIVKDAIAEGIPVTKGGLEHTDELITSLNGEVDDLLSKATGQTVDLGQMADDVRTWATKMFDRPGRDPRDLQAALAVADRIDRHPSLVSVPSVAKGPSSYGSGHGEVTPSWIVRQGEKYIGSFDTEAAAKQFASANASSDVTVAMPVANQIKRDIQRSAADKFGIPTGSAETAAEKYASSAMRRGIEAQVPAVGPLNARQSRLIDVAKAIARATGREENKSPLIGVNTMISGAIGGEEYARTHDPAAAAAKALAVRMALTPAVATRAAIVASRMAAKIPGTAIADIARVAVQAVSESQQKADSGP